MDYISSHIIIQIPLKDNFTHHVVRRQCNGMIRERMFWLILHWINLLNMFIRELFINNDLSFLTNYVLKLFRMFRHHRSQSPGRFTTNRWQHGRCRPERNPGWEEMEEDPVKHQNRCTLRGKDHISHQKGKGKSSTQKCRQVGDMLVPRRVALETMMWSHTPHPTAIPNSLKLPYEGCNLDADASLVSASSETFTSSSLAETSGVPGGVSWGWMNVKGLNLLWDV